MALFNFGKKKRKHPLVLASVVVRQMKQKKSQMTAVPKQRMEFAVLRYWVEAVNPATNSMRTLNRQ